jgi:hypothetical protein
VVGGFTMVVSVGEDDEGPVTGVISFPLVGCGVASLVALMTSGAFTYKACMAVFCYLRVLYRTRV